MSADGGPFRSVAVMKTGETRIVKNKKRDLGTITSAIQVAIFDCNRETRFGNPHTLVISRCFPKAVAIDRPFASTGIA